MKFVPYLIEIRNRNWAMKFIKMCPVTIHKFILLSPKATARTFFFFFNFTQNFPNFFIRSKYNNSARWILFFPEILVQGRVLDFSCLSWKCSLNTSTNSSRDTFIIFCRSYKGFFPMEFLQEFLSNFNQEFCRIVSGIFHGISKRIHGILLAIFFWVISRDSFIVFGFSLSFFFQDSSQDYFRTSVLGLLPIMVPSGFLPRFLKRFLQRLLRWSSRDSSTSAKKIL